jgi:hypothetical protein
MNVLENMWNKEVLAYFRYYSNIILGRLKKTIKILVRIVDLCSSFEYEGVPTI